MINENNFKIPDNRKTTISCIPTWLFEDIKAYFKPTFEIKTKTVTVSVVMKTEEKITAVGGPLRLAVLGSCEVGKSAFTVRYLTKRFIGEYRSDTGNYFSRFKNLIIT